MEEELQTQQEALDVPEEAPLVEEQVEQEDIPVMDEVTLEPIVVTPDEEPTVVEPDEEVDHGDPYWNYFNGMGVVIQNPELAFNSKTDIYGEINYEAPEFKALYDAADSETKRNMIGANNMSDALKIGERNAIYREAEEIILKDDIFTMVSNGAFPAIATPSLLMGGAAAYKVGSLGVKISKTIAAGAAIGAAAGIVDEAVFDSNGLPTDYVSAATFGAVLGGGFGVISGMLSGHQANKVTKALDKEADSFLRDFELDNTVNTRIDEEGNIQYQDAQAMDRSMIDKIPFIGDWLRSDINTALQSSNPAIRQAILRISPGTVSSKDAAGNPLPINKTGADKSRQLDGYINRLGQDVSEAFADAKNTGFVGSRDEYNRAVFREYVGAASIQRNAAVQHANHKLRDVVKSDNKAEFKRLHDEAMDEYYDSHTHVWDNHGKAAEGYKKYFDNMLGEGHGVKLEGLRSAKTNRLYMPRIYNYKAIKNGAITTDTIRGQIKAGLLNDARNGFKDVDELEKSIDSIHKMLMEGEFNTHLTSSNFKMDADLPFDSRLRNRKWYLDEASMPDLIMDNFEDIAGAYHYGMKGRISTQFAFGEESTSEIMDKVRQASLEKGHEVTAKDLNALKASIEDLQGQLRINNMSDTPAWTWSRNVATYNSVTKGGGFGMTQAIELTGAVMMSGMSAMMSGHFSKSLANSRKLLYQGGKDVDQFTNFLVDSGFMSSALHSHRVNRFADGESGFNSGVFENTLNGMSDGLQKYNGMRYMTGVMEDFAGASIGRKLMQQNASATDVASWGLTQQQFKALGAKLKEIETGTSWDLHKLAPEDADLFQLAISRGVSQIAVQGDSIHAPRWFKTIGPMGKLLFQFLRFPLVAQEILMRRGMAEAQAQMVAGMFGSSLAFVTLNSLREEAAINLGLKNQIDAEFDITNNPDHLESALMKSLNYNAPLGFMTSVWNYGAIFTGQNELGRDWVGKYGVSALVGPTGGMTEDLIQLIRAGVKGELTDERSIKRFKNLIPFMNAPLLSEGGKALAHELGD